jgi:hypothetical protein
LLAVSPAANDPPELVQTIYSRTENGIRLLASGNLDEARLSDAALRHLRTLSELTERPDRVPVTVRVWVRRKPVELKSDIGRLIREDQGAAYNDYGSIEGRLDMIADRDGNLLVQVRDAFFRQVVKCHLREELLTEAFAKFRKRVEVSGVIHYRSNGTPISIEAERIDCLPEDDELPSPADVRGILRPGA